MDVFDNAYKTRKLLFGTEVTDELAYVVDKFGVKGMALELGCGDGRDTFHMLEKGLVVEAVDKSSNAIKNLLTRPEIPAYMSSLCAYNADILKDNFKRSEYDFIYGITIIDHFTLDDCKRVLNTILPLLKKDGFLFQKVHTIDDDGFLDKKTASEFSAQILHYFKHNELLKLLEPYGRVLYYQESSEIDNSHGPKHWHSFASILIQI